MGPGMIKKPKSPNELSGPVLIYLGIYAGVGATFLILMYLAMINDYLRTFGCLSFAVVLWTGAAMWFFEKLHGRLWEQYWKDVEEYNAQSKV